jgi:hypothetical protein
MLISAFSPPHYILIDVEFVSVLYKLIITEKMSDVPQII